MSEFVIQRPERARWDGGRVKATTAAYPTGRGVTAKTTAEITQTRRRRTARCATPLAISPARTGAVSHGDGCVTLTMTAGTILMRLPSSAVSPLSSGFTVLVQVTSGVYCGRLWI